MQTYFSRNCKTNYCMKDLSKLYIRTMWYYIIWIPLNIVNILFSDNTAQHSV